MPEIFIKVVEIGAITDKPIREVLSILFSMDSPIKDTAVKLECEKEFNLPDEIEECVDWFIIE